MTNKEIVYGLILDLWNFVKKYGFEKLTDAKWEEQHKEALLLEQKYKSEGKPYEKLFRGLYDTVRTFYEDMNHDSEME